MKMRQEKERDEGIKCSGGEWEASKYAFLYLHGQFQEDTVLPESVCGYWIQAVLLGSTLELTVGHRESDLPLVC